MIARGFGDFLAFKYDCRLGKKLHRKSAVHSMEASVSRTFSILVSIPPFAWNFSQPWRWLHSDRRTGKSKTWCFLQPRVRAVRPAGYLQWSVHRDKLLTIQFHFILALGLIFLSWVLLNFWLPPLPLYTSDDLRCELCWFPLKLPSAYIVRGWRACVDSVTAVVGFVHINHLIDGSVQTFFAQLFLVAVWRPRQLISAI